MTGRFEDLPKGWASTTLENIGVWGSGGTPPRKDPTAYGGTIPWVKIGDLDDGPVSSTEEFLTEHGLEHSSAKLLREHVLLIAMYGASIGKLGITTGECTTNQAIASCDPHEGISLRYLFYWFLHQRQNLIGAGKGGAQPNISQTILKELQVPIAPSVEQVKIASRIDELFSSIDEGERALERVRKLVERYRQSVLKAAVTGELTREWREQHAGELESGEALLTQILEARRKAWETAELAKMTAKGQRPTNDLWKRKYREPVRPEPRDFQDAFPAGWTLASASELQSAEPHALGIGPFGSDLKVSDYRTSGVPLVFVRNIRANKFHENMTKFITKEKAADLKAHVVRSGDILITKMGAPPGDACAYPDVADGVITADCIKWRLNPILENRAYFVAFINSWLGRSQIKEMTKGVAQQKVTLDAFKKISVALPSLAEQEKIADRLRLEEERLEKVLEAVLLEARRLLAMKRSILESAFSGRLVSQDSTDEPASTLLERITAHRADPGLSRNRVRKSVFRRKAKA